METTPHAYWNSCYTATDLEAASCPPPWLARWRALAPAGRALDIGCGRGKDTAWLLAEGYNVTALDLSPEALMRSSQSNPAARHHLCDITRGLPLPDASEALVVANLSLHYFDRPTTEQVLREISRVLKPGGLLAMRVNAVGDTLSGCPATVQAWEVVLVEGIAKQFFTEAMLREALPADLAPKSIEALTVLRYGKEKRILECIAVKDTH